MASNHLFSAGFDVHTPTGNEDKALARDSGCSSRTWRRPPVIGSQSYLQTQWKLEFPKDNAWDDRVAVYNIISGGMRAAPVHVHVWCGTERRE
jgi:hypothetical protein